MPFDGTDVHDYNYWRRNAEQDLKIPEMEDGYYKNASDWYWDTQSAWEHNLYNANLCRAGVKYK